MLKHRVLYPLFVAAGLITLLVSIFGGSFWGFFLTLVLATGITAWGAFDIRMGYFTPTFFRQKGGPKRVVALTFDDGPSAYTAEILSLLKMYQCKATFFCIGKQVAVYPNLVQQMVEDGHTVGNHSYAHSNGFGFLKARHVVTELERCDAIIQQTTGKKTRLFRPPFGVTNPSVARAVRESKHQVIGWSNRSLDTVTGDVDTIYRRVCRKLKSGDIILFHDTSERTVLVLKKLLPDLQKKSFVSVSVDDLLNLQAYEQ